MPKILWEKMEVAPVRAKPVRRTRHQAAMARRSERSRRELEPGPEVKAIVLNMAAYGYPVHHILRVTGLQKAQLRYLKTEIQTAGIKKDLDVLESGYLQAVGGPEKDWSKADGAMTRFYMERRLGWVPPPSRSVSLNANMDLDRLSDDQLLQLESLMALAQKD
jgi:hypothetical protein